MAMGVRGSLLLLIPAFSFAVILHHHMNRLRARIAHHKKAARAISEDGRDRWLPFSFLTMTIICRSIIFFGFNTFLPLYWIHHLHQTKAAGGMALTVLLLSSAVGTLAGGKLADRIGDWKLNFSALIALPFLIGLFLLATRADLALASLIPLGACMSATFSVMVVMGQRYLPRRIGLAAGVTLGLAGSIGGLVAPILGKIADTYGLHTALSTLIGVSAVSLLLASATALAERAPTR
jgi:FSR family fosmidomycin resistance protein-like MFS transporter